MSFRTETYPSPYIQNAFLLRGLTFTLKDCTHFSLISNKVELLPKIGNCLYYVTSILNIPLFNAKEIKENKIKIKSLASNCGTTTW